MDPQRGDAPERARSGLAARLARHACASAAERWHATGAAARLLWARRPSASRAVAGGFAVVLALAGAVGVVFQGGLPGRLPDPIDWAALGALLERDALPGDAVAVSPAWAERARLAAPGAVPLLSPASWKDEDLPGVKRVWLVSLPRAPGFGFGVERALLARSARPEPAIPLGGLSVTRHALAAPERPLAFLPDRLAHAEVRLGGAPCARDAAGFRCPLEGGGAAEVIRTVRQVGGAPRPCVAVPAGAGAALTVTFPAAPMGRQLRGHAGLAGDPPRARDAAIRIALRVDGEEAGAVDLAGGGWRSFALDTARSAGRMRELALSVTTTASTGALCLDAMTFR